MTLTNAGQKFDQQIIASGAGDWSAGINIAVQQATERTIFPMCKPHVYVDSAANPDTDQFLNLEDLPAASYAGQEVWVVDAVNGNNGYNSTNSKGDKTAMSDGSQWNWRYDLDQQVTSIS